MRALITGGSGYLGRHITQQLIKAGWDVINYDLNKPLITFHPERDEWVEGDINDTSLLTTCFQCYPVDLVIHAALCRDLPAGSLKAVDDMAALNVEGTRSLLWAMASVGCERLIALSGARVYGFCQQPYIVEEAPLAPEGKIGESLKSAEEMMVEFRQGLPGRLALLRVFEVYGYGSDELFKVFATPQRDGLLAHLEAWKKDESSQLSGNDFCTRDGSYVRDYLHVSDLTRIVSEAIKFLDLEPELICNLGLGKGYSQLDLIKMLESCSGLTAKFTVQNRRPEEAPRLVANKEYLFAWCGEEFLEFPKGLKKLTESMGYVGIEPEQMAEPENVPHVATEEANPVEADAVAAAVQEPIDSKTVEAAPKHPVPETQSADDDEDEDEDSPWSIMEDVTGPSDSVLRAVAAASAKLDLFE